MHFTCTIGEQFVVSSAVDTKWSNEHEILLAVV